MSKTYAVALIAALGAVGAPQGYAAARSTAAVTPAAVTDAGVETNVDRVFQTSFYVPCANGGTGEIVTLAGLIHEVYNVTTDGGGYAHVMMHSQPMGVSGTGTTSGYRYRGTGVTQEVMNTRFGTQLSLENIINIIGPGPGNNFMMHQTVHMSVSADGTVSADRSSTTFVCQ